MSKHPSAEQAGLLKQAVKTDRLRYLLAKSGLLKHQSSVTFRRCRRSWSTPFWNPMIRDLVARPRLVVRPRPQTDVCGNCSRRKF